jgi:diaminopimelate decarboxylase
MVIRIEYEKWLKNKDLEYQNNSLYFNDFNVQDLAKQFGTPIYITNEQTIRKRYKALKNVIDSIYKENDIHYAVKANSNLSIIKILNSEGSFFDCTSQGEVYTCLKAGIEPNKIIYTGNMFTDEEFEYAVNNDILVNLDSLSQLPRLVRVHEKLGKRKKGVSFRINPEFGAGHHTHTITAGKEIKFGILDNQVIEAYQKAKKLGFKTFGIHQHIGSGIINPQDFEKAVKKYLDTIRNLAKILQIKFEFVDFGGGLGIPYRPEEEPLDLKIYKNLVVKPFKKLIEEMDIGSPVFKIEPGRYLSAESTILVTKINTIKDNGYKLFAGVDAGFNTLVRPTMYGSYHHIIPCSRSGEEIIYEYDIAGPICESGDILGRNRKLFELKEHDLLAILDAGAYGYVMSSSYNSRPRPAEILINNGDTFLIRKAETIDELLASQSIPKHLE